MSPALGQPAVVKHIDVWIDKHGLCLLWALLMSCHRLRQVLRWCSERLLEELVTETVPKEVNWSLHPSRWHDFERMNLLSRSAAFLNHDPSIQRALTLHGYVSLYWRWCAPDSKPKCLFWKGHDGQWATQEQLMLRKISNCLRPSIWQEAVASASQYLAT